MTVAVNQEHWDCGCTVDVNTRLLINRCALHSTVPEHMKVFRYIPKDDRSCPSASAHFIIHGDGRVEQKRPIGGTAWRTGGLS